MDIGAAAFALARSGERKEAEALARQMEAMPANTWTRWVGLAMAFTGLADFERAIDAMEHAAAGDGDLFVSFSPVLAGALPPDPRVDAVYRRFNLEPARFATRPGAQRP